MITLAAAHAAAHPQSNLPGWILLIAIIAVVVWAFGRWLKS